MKIGVLGSGDVAKTLAAGFLKHGHAVMMGTRETGKLADWQRENSKGRLGSFADAAAFGEVVVLAVKGSAATDVLRLAGSANLDGKPVIDACNPICRCASGEWGVEVLYDAGRIADGAAATRVPQSAFGEGLQFRWRSSDGESGVQRGLADHVHLRERCRREGGDDEDSRSVWLGDGGHGHGGSGARY